MADIPMSITQKRVLTLYNLESDGTYSHSARVLEAVGLPADGCPAGLNWRAVKKLTDDELIQKLGVSERKQVQVKTSQEVKNEYNQLAHERKRIRKLLKRHGYRWHKMDEEDWDMFGPIPGSMDWVLYSPDGREVTVKQALEEIEKK